MKTLYSDIIADDDIFTNGIQAQKHQWKKFMGHKGDYIEK